jgi:hypothetical protein
MNTNDTQDDITMAEVLGTVEVIGTAQTVDKDSADYEAGYSDCAAHVRELESQDSKKHAEVWQLDAADTALVIFDDKLANADYIKDKGDLGDPCFSVIDKRTGECIAANSAVWELINDDLWFDDDGVFRNGRQYFGYETRERAINAVVEIRHVIAATRAVLTVKRIYRDARKQNRSGKTEC